MRLSSSKMSATRRRLDHESHRRPASANPDGPRRGRPERGPRGCRRHRWRPGDGELQHDLPVLDVVLRGRRGPWRRRPWRRGPRWRRAWWRRPWFRPFKRLTSRQKIGSSPPTQRRPARQAMVRGGCGPAPR
jgi:hypothetical protein